MSTTPTKGEAKPVALLPCPFCGSSDIKAKQGKTLMLDCQGCGVVLTNYKDGVMRDPYVVWNTRAHQPEPAAPGGELSDTARLDALEKIGTTNQWIIARNFDSYTVGRVTRNTLREAIDAAILAAAKEPRA